LKQTDPASLDPEIREKLLTYQEAEITEHHIYQWLAQNADTPENSRILEEIAEDELRHYRVWRKFTGQDVEPNRWRIWMYLLISRLLGYTFAIKLMEQGEAGAQDNYAALTVVIPAAAAIAKDENQHEEACIALLDEERLQYTGSIVLGLNDALVELTGALAGLTLALQDTQLIALTGPSPASPPPSPWVLRSTSRPVPRSPRSNRSGPRSTPAGPTS
jgi:rubrerythrin